VLPWPYTLKAGEEVKQSIKVKLSGSASGGTKAAADKGIEIKIGHQVCLNIVNRFTQGFDKFIKIFFVQKDLMPIVTLTLKLLTTFSNGKIVIVASGSPYIKKVSSSFPGSDAFAINAFHPFVVVFVRHSSNDFSVNECV